jgi:hypothetical protein
MLIKVHIEIHILTTFLYIVLHEQQRKWALGYKLRAGFQWNCLIAVHEMSFARVCLLSA